MENYDRFITSALKLADELPPRPYVFISFALLGGKIAGASANIYRTHPISLSHPYMLGECSTLHAEAAAILQVRAERRHKLELVVVRVPRDRSRIVAPARPCDGCLSFIKECGIRKVTYTIAPGEWGTIHPRKS